MKNLLSGVSSNPQNTILHIFQSAKLQKKDETAKTVSLSPLCLSNCLHTSNTGLLSLIATVNFYQNTIRPFFACSSIFFPGTR